MGWDADATKDGEMLEMQGDDMGHLEIADPVLRAAFADAAVCVKRNWGTGRMDMAIGQLDGYDYKQVIERATGERCFIPFDIEWIGEMHWPPATVLRLSAGAEWDFPTEDLIENESDEICSDWYVDYRVEARLFLETCAEQGLGIRFSW
jgi:hypothetical protein